MSVVPRRVLGWVRLFQVRPQGAVGSGGHMALADHLREFRTRLLRSVLVFLVVLIGSFFFYDQLIDLITDPYFKAAADLKKQGVDTEAVISGSPGASLMLNLKVCALAAAIVTSPYWLWQLWAFIVPGLTSRERKWSRVVMAVTGPLFLLGVGVGYYVLPKGLEVLIGFTPDKFKQLTDFSEYFSFFNRMLLIFGISFEIPFFVVLLNLAGVVPARYLAEYRPWIIIGVFVFAAVATPSTDPFSMILLAIPMTVLFLIAEVIARFTDRRRRVATDTGLGDDEATPDDLL